MSFATRAIHADCTAQLTLATPLGEVLLARTAGGLAGAWFAGQKDHPGVLAAPQRPDDPLLRAAADQLEAYFAGRATRFDLPLDLRGTDFQRSVWHALMAIASGGTRSYREIALQVGSARAVRAVGAAVGKNPLSVIVPCHRVVGSSGELTGYAGGLDRKRALLRLEGGGRWE
ncbi:MAG TPA: methylated-DNA--[protein]-cysteine S-methyltransferase [Albitalea sp.]|uniref:methylated-DNA--[protein]-cysteine S-methyltransferase n=1 Tax=Piscinibacter sp. TaxID=1903157 RepID=UPI002ED0A5D4